MADVSERVCLTYREDEIIRLVAQGLTYKEAARQLKLSPRMVEAYARKARDNNSCLSVTHLVSKYIMAVSRGTVEVSPQKPILPVSSTTLKPAARLTKARRQHPVESPRVDLMDAWRQSFQRHREYQEGQNTVVSGAAPALNAE